MHGVGGIESCGVNAFLAGNERYANPGTTFMFHPSTTSFKQEVSLSIDQLKLEVLKLQNDQEKIVENILLHTTYEKEEALSHIQRGIVLNTQHALEKKIIHEVKKFQIKPNCPILQSEKIHVENPGRP
jgi:ATP-dependent protease ClpP protease subunit